MEGGAGKQDDKILHHFCNRLTANVLVQTAANLLIYLVGWRAALTLIVLAPTLHQTVRSETTSATVPAANLHEITRIRRGLEEMVLAPAYDAPVLHDAAAVRLSG